MFISKIKLQTMVDEAIERQIETAIKRLDLYNDAACENLNKQLHDIFKKSDEKQDKQNAHMKDHAALLEGWLREIKDFMMAKK